MAAITATLARYPESIITAITHPVSGLPSRSKWLPTVKEVFDACEIEADRERQKILREQRIADQLADREREAAAPVKPTLGELKAKYGDDWGLTVHERPKQTPARAPSLEQCQAFYRANPDRAARLFGPREA